MGAVMKDHVSKEMQDNLGVEEKRLVSEGHPDQEERQENIMGSETKLREKAEHGELEKGHERIEITIKRKGEKQWGMKLSPENRSLQVVGIESGAVLRHCKEGKRPCIAAGDLILSVNGIIGDSTVLIEEIKKSARQIKVLIERGHEEDPLEEVLDGFFTAFDNFETGFGGKVRASVEKGDNKTYDQLKALQAQMASDAPPALEDVQAGFDKMGLGKEELEQRGIFRGQQWADLVDELTLAPKIPTGRLKELKKSWRDGGKDSVSVLAELTGMHEKKEVPSGWLHMGADHDELEEVKEDEAQASAKASAKDM